MEARAPKDLHDTITEKMGHPEGIFMSVDPDPASRWHVTVSGSGDSARIGRLNQVAQQIAVELRKKFSLKA